MDLYIDNRSETPIDETLIKQLEVCVGECIKIENFPDNTEVSLSLVSDDEIQELNRIYRNKDCPTDVISFPMIEQGEIIEDMEFVLLGDIIISIPKTLEQSTEYGHSFEREICYLTIHGMFHLLGYDHMEEEDKRAMREKEKEVINNLNIY